MIEDVALEKNCSLGELGGLVGDGTMPNPGKSRLLEVPDVAETVKETKLGKIRLLLGETAVPSTSGLLEMAVCGVATGMVFGELEDSAGLLGGATHLVHSVDVEVRVTVEMVVVISSNDVPPELTRLVTGQVVKVV